MSTKSPLFKEYIAAAEDLKQSNSEDFCLGFQMGVAWLVSYIEKLMEQECQYLLENSDAESLKNTD